MLRKKWAEVSVRQLRLIPVLTFLATLSPAAMIPGHLSGQSRQFRGTPTLNGVVDTRGVEVFGGVAWRFETEGTVRSTPALSESTLYVGASDGLLYALDPGSGELRWSFDAGSPISSSPAVWGNVVLVASRDGVLHGINTSGGELLWRKMTGPDLPLDWGYEGWDYILSSPSLAGDTAYWGGGDGRVYALDPQTGEEFWNVQTGARIRSSPAVADGLLVIGNSAGILFALDARTGSERWRFETAGATLDAEDFGFDRRQISASPVLFDGKVYVGSRDASLYALDAMDGSLLWTFAEESAWIITTAAVTAERVYSGRSSSGNLRALDRETGTELWKIEAGGYVYSSPVVADGILYVGQGDGEFAALDAETGEERWSYRTGAAIYSTPVVHDGRIYVGSDDGFVYAFQAAEDVPYRRAVFFDDGLRARSTVGRADRDLVIREYFAGRGYELLDSEGLDSFLRDGIARRGYGVVVFAMDALPQGVGRASPGRPLLKRYLEAGGKVVWMGYPPEYLIWDTGSGNVMGIDRGTAAALTGVSFEAFLGDSHGITPTEAGYRWGLRGRTLGSGSALPEEVTVVLALDELGRAAAWVKSHGGPPGSGFVLLPAAFSTSELAEVQRVAEYRGGG